MWLSDERLALLIMLIITIPIQNHAVKLNMPISESTPQRVPLKVIRIVIDGDGIMLWSGEPFARRPAPEARWCIAASQK